MNSSSLTTRQNLGAGAVTGFLAWLTYGALEQYLLAVVPRLMGKPEGYRPVHLGFSIACMMLYAATGALLGVMAATLLEKASSRYRNAGLRSRKQALGGVLSILLLMAIAAGSFFSRAVIADSRLKYLMLNAALVVAIAALAGLAVWLRPLRLYTDPAVVFFLFLGCLWSISKLKDMGIYSPVWRAGAVVTVGLIVTFCGWLGHRLMRRNEESIVSGRALAFTLLFAGIALALTGAIKNEPVRRNASTVRPTGHRPNVVLIVMDTVRADHLSLYGYGKNTSPNLSEFANHATLYSPSLAVGDMSLHTHATLFTGLYPDRHAAHYTDREPAGHPLSRNVRTLAEMLADQGHATAAVVANEVYVTTTFGFDQGFQFFDQAAAHMVWGDVIPDFCLRKLLVKLADMLPGGKAAYRPAAEINASALAAVDEMKATGRPFFLFVNYMDAHYPYVAHPEFDSQYHPAGTLPDQDEWQSWQHQVLGNRQDLSQQQKNRLIPRYDAEIAYIDSQLGSLFNDLRARNVFEDTLVIVTSDHGDAFGEDACMNHGGMSVRQFLTGVPLIVKYPGAGQPASINQITSQVDIVPTVLDVLGYSVPSDLDGVSLRKAGEQGKRPVYSKCYPGGSGQMHNAKRFKNVITAVVADSTKLITSAGAAPQLFDLEHDPSEQHNLYSERAAIAKELESLKDDWQKTQTAKARQVESTVDPATMDKLKSLGYVGGK